MANSDEIRVSLRRAAHDLNDAVWQFAEKVEAVDTEAARALTRAHIALFEAWTHLCTPPDDHEDEDH